jgi:hypothetical protein
MTDDAVSQAAEHPGEDADSTGRDRAPDVPPPWLRDLKTIIDRKERRRSFWDVFFPMLGVVLGGAIGVVGSFAVAFFRATRPRGSCFDRIGSSSTRRTRMPRTPTP